MTTKTFDNLYKTYAKEIDSENMRLIPKNAEKLYNKLNAEEKEMLDKLTETYGEALTDIAHESFRQGFCASVRLVYDMFGELPQ